MATISPKRGFSVATVATVWLPVFTCAVAEKTAVSQVSFPFNSTKISQFLRWQKFQSGMYALNTVFYAKLNDQLTYSDLRQSHL